MTDGMQRAPEITPDLRLRAERPQVTRLSRKVLIGLGGVAGLAIAAALIYALQTRRGDQAGKELYSTENRTPADGPLVHRKPVSPCRRRGRCRSRESHPRTSGACRKSRRRA